MRAALVPQAEINFIENSEIKKQFNQSKIHFAFGGGIGSFGRNFTLFYLNNTTIWIDFGAGFSNNQTPGLSKTLPNTELAKEFPPDAIFFTHAHEDHIGGLPFIYKSLKEKTKIYGSKFTINSIRYRLDDLGLEKRSSIDNSKFEFIVIDENETFEINDFLVSIFFVNHSIPQSFSVGLQSKITKEKLFFTGDFKTLGTEPRFSQKAIQDYGSIDYLFIDSTGSLSTGYSENENEILENLKELIKNHQGRVLVTTFSSQIIRLRNLFKIAEKLKRSIGIQGYSLKANLNIAYESEEFDHFILNHKNPSKNDKKSIWIISGCQADQHSAFYRLAKSELQGFTLREDDLLLYSASIIPGNEADVFWALNKISQRGVKIVGINQSYKKIHTSGHGKQQDIIDLIKWLDPKNIIPVHGDYIHFNALQNLLELKNRNIHKHLEKNIIFEINSDTKEKITTIQEVENLESYIENNEIHHENTIYKLRQISAQEGVCSIVVHREKKLLLALNYIAVSTYEIIDANEEALKADIQSIVSTIDSEDDHVPYRYIKKINKINSLYLKKNPLVQVIWLDEK